VGFEGQLVRSSLLDRLAEQLEARITSGEFAEGERMPSEDALAKEYGVSRPLVREAFARLRARGFLETRNGRGTFVRHPDASHLADTFLQQISRFGTRQLTADNLYEARSAIETVATRLAAVRAVEQDYLDLGGLLSQMEASADHDAAGFARADFGFHLAVAKASGNPILPIMLAPLVHIVVGGVYQTASDPAATHTGIRDHRQIRVALRKRDQRAAAKAMEGHLVGSRQFYPHEFIDTSTLERRINMGGNAPGGGH
jgi:DNA-binding FadR family transcriptional regulator